MPVLSAPTVAAVMWNRLNSETENSSLELSFTSLQRTYRHRIHWGLPDLMGMSRSLLHLQIPHLNLEM
ncbi:hypothetical protein SAMN04487948_11824 [Halogranum amylolyticum]|uniref:Uncharacterized protein n=1 Tax=Halogranum amylolyticum TaxID=660520 RepID=A0A1H8VN74_9EURY|nr:hypothetical protein SAMN04487948_11824 [Halogranum amylolyticum]